MAGIARLMTTLANVLPGIERSVMPRWLEHVRASPFRFQNGRIISLRQSSGVMSSVVQRGQSFGWLARSINSSVGGVSG